MKCHIIKKTLGYMQGPSSYLRSYSVQVSLVVAYFSNDSSFTLKLNSILYKTTAKLVKVVLNLLFTVPAIEMFKNKNFGQLQ